MHSIIIPTLILATVALSSSNVLPLLSMNEGNEEPLDYEFQQEDNTFSNKYNNKDNVDAILFKVDEPKYHKTLPAYDMDSDNRDLNSISKNYNMKGFRKEQWHNYPRQLDRLNKYLYEEHSTDKRNLDPDDPGNDYSNDEESQLIKNNIPSNEINLESETDIRKIHNGAKVAAAVINPLLIFRIQLACYNKALEDIRKSTDLHDNIEESVQKNIVNEENPESSLPKVKREGNIKPQADKSMQKSSKNRSMKKRLFSLWSRLQSLNHKGHELHHRRHLYALYGLPNSDVGGGGGILTAETRATFMRPPGSPLRWG